MKKIVCITWASSWIGKACVYEFSQRWYDCILLARNLERIEAIAKEVSTKYNNKCFVASVDVQDSTQVMNFFTTLPLNRQRIHVLINNAWLALGIASLKDLILEDMHTMIDTNVKWLLYTTKYAIPFLSHWDGAHIINIGSISAISYYPWGTVYCASKAAVKAITECLRLELKDENILATCIHPWMVETEFQQVRFRWNKELEKSFMEMRLRNGKQLSAGEVAACVFDVVGKNISELILWHKQ